MTAIDIASIGSVSQARADNHSLVTIVLFCFVGLAASLCLMTFGMDLSAGLV